jgi:hypothetical protein
MTLGQVYDLDLRKNENLIKDVVMQAQGEVCSKVLRMKLEAHLSDGTGGIFKASP